MNLDANKLIIQLNGDAGDTLANQATWAVAKKLNPSAMATPTPRVWNLLNVLRAWDYSGAQIMLEDGGRYEGIYVRNPEPKSSWWSNPHTVTRDQLLSVLLANLLHGLHRENGRLVWRIIKRFGFAQNIYRNGADGVKQGKKTPDTFLGHFQFFIRPFPLLSVLLWPVLLATDLVALLVKTPFDCLPYVMRDGGKIVKRSYDDVDVRNSVLGHIMAMQMPTPFSWLRRQLFATLMHKNFGMIHQTMWPRMEELHKEHPISREVFDAWLKHCPGEKNKVTAALLWYFRPSSFGNIEIAYALEPIMHKYFRGFRWPLK